MSKAKYTIVIVDDHPMIAEGLESILNRDPKLEVAAKFGTGKALLNYLKSDMPDLILLDINLPEMDGIEVAKILRSRYPDLKVVCISTHNHTSIYRTLQAIPINGFIPKLTDTQVLVKAVHSILKGQNLYLKEERETANETKSNTAVISKYQLTRRETEIMQLIKQNKTSKEIADCLSISLYTVETHRRNICNKLGLNTTQALLKFSEDNF